MSQLPIFHVSILDILGLNLSFLLIDFTLININFSERGIISSDDKEIGQHSGIIITFMNLQLFIGIVRLI